MFSQSYFLYNALANVFFLLFNNTFRKGRPLVGNCTVLVERQTFLGNRTRNSFM